MGNMIEASILVDAWDQVEKNPEQLVSGLRQFGLHGRFSGRAWGTHFPVDNHAGAVTVHPVHRADDKRIYLSRYNSFVDLTHLQYGQVFENETPANLQLLEDDLDSSIRSLTDTLVALRQHKSKARA